MNKKQRLIHGTMLAAAMGNAVPFQIVSPANAQQAVNVQGIGGTALSSACASSLSSLGASIPAVVCQWGGVYVINAAPNGAHNVANSPTVNLATDQTTADPCVYQMKSFTSFAFTTLGTTQIIAGVSGQKIYACSLAMIVSTGTNVSFTEGSNATCSTTAAGVFGNPGTTPGNGLPLLAGGGLTLGNGEGLIFKTANATNGICVINAATSLAVGTLGYVQQ